jgi:hypothetical protein
MTSILWYIINIVQTFQCLLSIIYTKWTLSYDKLSTLSRLLSVYNWVLFIENDLRPILSTLSRLSSVYWVLFIQNDLRPMISENYLYKMTSVLWYLSIIYTKWPPSYDIWVLFIQNDLRLMMYYQHCPDFPVYTEYYLYLWYIINIVQTSQCILYNYGPITCWICCVIDQKIRYWPRRSRGQYLIFWSIMKYIQQLKGP